MEVRLAAQRVARVSSLKKPPVLRSPHGRNFATGQILGSVADSPGSKGKGRADEGGEDKKGFFRSFINSTAAEAAMGASAGVVLLGLAGMGYHKWYKLNVLTKMEKAFDPGYDPVLNLIQSTDKKAGEHGGVAYIHVTGREEEDLIRRVLRGEERGRYFLVLGPKGSGKQTALIRAMAAQQADGCAFFEAHADPSIVVDRFSEAINFSMNRDYIGSAFGLSDLQGMSSFQHLERALHKLESALIRRRQRTGKPAIVIMNSAHLLGQEEDGIKFLTVLQQRAEKWASSGTATFIFTSNDHFVYDVLRRHSNRMETITFKDLSLEQSIAVLQECRAQYFPSSPSSSSSSSSIATSVTELETLYCLLGGRPSHLNLIARQPDMISAAQQLIYDDLQYTFSKTGIIEDHDDDVMDQQKFATCSWLLFLEFARREQAMDASSKEEGSSSPSAHSTEVDRLPSISYAQALQTMTRPDFISELDRMNFIHIDSHHTLWPQSTALLRGWRQVLERGDGVVVPTTTSGPASASASGSGSDVQGQNQAKSAEDDREDTFEEKLTRVMDRVSAIESLGRTREVVLKEMGPQGRFLVKRDGKGNVVQRWDWIGAGERLGWDERE